MYLSDFDAKNFELIRSLAEQNFSVPVTDIKKLPGSMSYNFEINHRHIFKLPKESTSQEDWMRQAHLAPILQSHFNFQIPTPKLKILSLPDKTTLLSSSYSKIDGICFSNDLEFAAKDKKFKTNFFEQLSDGAAQIHSFPLKSLPFTLPTKIDYLEKCFFKDSKKDNYLPKKLFRKLLHNSFFGFGKSGLKKSLLVHTDLHSGNVLLDDKGKLVAILDFDMLVQGDRFLEFRPGLYEDPLDIRLFQKIYQERTGIKINQEEVNQQEIVHSSLSWFYHLYQLYQFLPIPDRNMRLLHNFKQKMHSERL